MKLNIDDIKDILLEIDDSRWFKSSVKRKVINNHQRYSEVFYIKIEHINSIGHDSILFSPSQDDFILETVYRISEYVNMTNHKLSLYTGLTSRDRISNDDRMGNSVSLNTLSETGMVNSIIIVID